MGVPQFTIEQPELVVQAPEAWQVRAEAVPVKPVAHDTVRVDSNTEVPEAML